MGGSRIRTVALEVRNRRFGRDTAASRRAMGGEPYASAVYGAISAALVVGEQFFIETLNEYRDSVPEPLRAEVRKFVAQEALHSREHHSLNRRIEDAGYDLAPLTAAPMRRLADIRTKPIEIRLAATMALEHFTAVLAHHLLADPRHLAPADPETRALWRWHSVEEIEHKGLAYDCWLHASRDWSAWRRWRVRSLVMLLCTRNFMVDRTRGMIELLRQDGLTGPLVWARLAWFTLVRPGIMGRLWLAWPRFFRPGFHPWSHDDYHLIAAERHDRSPADTPAAPAWRKLRLPRLTRAL